MENLSIEEKSRRYDRAIINGSRLWECGLITRETYETIFPELQESEDERIRKNLISCISTLKHPLFSETERKEFIAWLEKQGEHQKSANKEYTFKAIPRLLWMIQPTDRAKAYCQKLIDSLEKEGYSIDAKIVRDWLKLMNGEKVAMATMDGQKPANKTESKLKIEKDKWYVCIRDLYDAYGTRAFSKGYTYHSTKDETLIPDNSNIPFEIKYCVNDYFRLWTIEEARDGNVLAFDDNTIVIFKDLYNATSFHSYCHIEDGEFCTDEDEMPAWWEGNGFHPATREQCDTLFAKMKEAGYEWDSEKRELKKIS